MTLQFGNKGNKYKPRRINSTTTGSSITDDGSNIEDVFQRGLTLLTLQDRVGCNVESDPDLICLNYGLHLATQDRFAEACDVPGRPAARQQIIEDATTATSTASTTSRIVQYAYRLWSFCRQQFSVGKE
jgi:hypothetical protein